MDVVEAAPVDSVLDAADFEKFMADYEKAWVEMMKKAKEG